MKLKLILFFLFVNIVCIEQTIAQKLTLTDLTAICNKKNWEDVDKYLFARGWTYFSSSKGDSEHYNTVTWSYNLNSYNDKAEAWFYLYNYDDFPNKIEYNVFNKPAYSLIYNNISSNGFKSVESNIDDDLVTTKYANATYYLEIYNQKRTDDDSYYSSSSITAYGIRLVKKSGVYDPDNGKKTTYYDNYNVNEEYTLKNGEFHGEFKSYHENGELEMKGNFINGKANGNFIVYNSYGEKTSELEMKNGLKEGKGLIFENNKISEESIYKNNQRNGESSLYYYDDNGRLIMKINGSFKDDQKYGLWKSIVITDINTEVLLSENNYINGVLEGSFKEYINDTLKIGYYIDNLLNGDYLEYFNINRQINGGYATSDTTKLTLITKGRYSNGNKVGNWSHKFSTGTIESFGKYQNDKKEGEWKYYYNNYVLKDKIADYAGKLYLIETYKNGELNGKKIRYSTLEETEPFPCGNNETCTELVCKKLTQIHNYKNDLLNGTSEIIDSLGNLLVKGNYYNGIENGEWLFNYYDENKKLVIKEIGSFNNGKKNGKWVKKSPEDKIILTREFKNDVLDGIVEKFEVTGELSFRKVYEKDKLILWEQFDSTGINLDFSAKLIIDYNKEFLYELTSYFSGGYVIQENRISNVDPKIELNLESYLIDPTIYIEEKHGKYELYMNEKLIQKGQYANDTKNGEWSYFYYDQNVVEKQKFSFNAKTGAEMYYLLSGELFSGTFTYSDVPNNVIEKRKIEDGLRNGKTTYIDMTTNKKIKKENYKDGILD